MKRLFIIGLIFPLFFIGSVIAQDNGIYHYEECNDSGDGWIYCEKGTFHQKIIRDGKDKGHLIFINQGTIKISYNGEIVYMGANPSSVIAHSNEELPQYWTIYDFDTYIFRDIDYDFYEDKVCTFIQFRKLTNGNNTFDKGGYICYYLN